MMEQKRRGVRLSNLQRLMIIPLSILALFVIWKMAVRITKFPPFILPPPGLVWNKFVTVLSDGSLVRHLWVTLIEVLVGLTVGVAFATILGYFLAKSRLVERLLSPYIVASQSVPIVAIAPLLVIWFGAGLFSKILICALIVFFPVLVNTVVGLKSVSEDLHALMRSLQATRLQTIRYLEIPSAMPVFLGGLRIGATLSVIGAVVGEFVGSDRGLGFMINRARGQYDTALVFVAVFSLVFVAISLYTSVLLLEKKLLSWREPDDQPYKI